VNIIGMVSMMVWLVYLLIYAGEASVHYCGGKRWGRVLWFTTD
jgi:hypothetical protein